MLHGGEIPHVEGIDAGGVAHVPEQAALAPEHVLQHLFVVLVVPFGAEEIVPVVAVAQEHMGVAPAGQLHQDAQHAQALLPFFQKVPVDDQLVPVGKANLAQHALEIGDVAVDVRDHQEPPAGLRVPAENVRFHHRSSRLSVRGRSSSRSRPWLPSSSPTQEKPSRR